jgi:hypothetical protein
MIEGGRRENLARHDMLILSVKMFRYTNPAFMANIRVSGGFNWLSKAELS